MPADICRFADFELDRSAYQLRRKGRPARIERIPLDLLFLLAERPGQLVTREEILERIWGKDVFLDTDNSINAAIRKIRQVLRDDAETPRFVATVPTKGYRFIASLHETQRETPGDQSVSNGKNEVAPPQIYVARPEPESFEPPSGPADAFAHGGRVVSLAEEAELCKPPQPALRPHTSVKTVGAGAMSALVFIAALLIWRWMGEGSSNRPSSPTVHTIAVLPLENLSGDPGQEYFADGMTDELITDLAKISGLRVISRTSVMRFKGEHRERLAEIAKALDVDTIVEGTVLRVGDKVRITAQLIDAPSDNHLWAESYERDTGDVMTLQDELASTIARQINVELTPDEQARLAKPHPVDPHELEAILKGFYFVTKQTGGGMQKGREYFEQAIKIAPGHAWGYIGLATYYVTAADLVLSNQEAMPTAKQLLTTALRLDDNIAMAHSQLGIIYWNYDYDWIAAEKENRRAIALEPGTAYAHGLYGYMLLFQGRFEEAEGELKRAQQLDPLSPWNYAALGQVLNVRQDYPKALEQCRKAIEIDPNYWPAYSYCLGFSYDGTGNQREALKALEKGVAIEPGPAPIAIIGADYAMTGNRAQAYKVIDQLNRLSAQTYVSPCRPASIYLALGEKNTALTSWKRRTRNAADALSILRSCLDGSRCAPTRASSRC